MTFPDAPTILTTPADPTRYVVTVNGTPREILPAGTDETNANNWLHKRQREWGRRATVGMTPPVPELTALIW